jgi:hypothetical protein
MTIFRSAYDTFACQDFVMTRTEHALDTVLYTGHLQMIPGSRTRELIGGIAMTDAVPAFAHPIVLDNRKEETTDVVVDARAFGKYDPHKQAFVVRNKTEYDFIVLRGRLNTAWVSEAPSLLLNVSPLGMKMFAAWVAENLTKKLALDPREATVLQVYAAFYYHSLHLEDHPLSPSDKHRIIAAITKSTGIIASMVVEVVEHFEHPISGVEQFCKLAQEVVASVRLAQLNVGLLYAILKSTWYGSGAAELVTVALEHPPTWLSMVAMASQDRSYKNAAINHLLERQDRRDKGQTFLRAIRNMLDAAQA